MVSWILENYIILLFAIPTYTHLKLKKKYGIVRCLLYYYIRAGFRRIRK